MPAVHRPHETAVLVREEFGSAPVRVAELLERGISRQRVRSAVAAGTLVTVRHGVVQAAQAADLVEAGSAAQSDPRFSEDRRAQHLAAARAALLTLADDCVVSHGSAALSQRLPTYRAPAEDVWVTAPRHGRIVAGTHRMLGTVEPVDRDIMAGVPVTSVARTALDLARRRPPHESLVALDAAAARVGLRELRAAMARLDWVYDLRRLSEALTLTASAAESPLESISRGWMHECGVVPPLLQEWVTADDGRRYRVDFLWPDHRVIGEADGLGKYASIADVQAEKLREDALRRAGYTVVRWTYHELVTNPAAVIDRIRAALAAAH